MVAEFDSLDSYQLFGIMMKAYEAIPFTNEIGQTLNPGDEVLFIVSGYSHQIDIRLGTYLGIADGKVRVSYVQPKQNRWVDSDGNIVNLNYDWSMLDGLSGWAQRAE